MQRGFLQGEADGVLGERTDAATRAYQQQQGLKVDGIVGALTLAKPVYDERANA